MENIQKLLCEMRVDFFVLLKIQDKRNKRLHHSKPFKCSWSLAFGVLRMRNACGIICKYLTIIPRARMGYESIDHEAEGRMVYWLRAHEGERNNCFSKIQLVGQKNIEAKHLSLV